MTPDRSITPQPWSETRDWAEHLLQATPAEAIDPCPQCHVAAGWDTTRGTGHTTTCRIILFVWRCRHCHHDNLWDLTRDAWTVLTKEHYQDHRAETAPARSICWF